MKTIIYIGGFRLPDGNAAAPRVLNNAKIFRDLGYNIIFIDVADNVSGNLFDNFRNIEGFDCYSKKYPSGFEWYSYLTSVSDVKKVITKYENVKFVIAYNYQSAAFLRLCRYCKKHDIKLISDCTEWYGKTNILKDIDTDLRMKYIQKRIDGVIAISGFLYDYYKDCTNTVQIPPLTDCEDEQWKHKHKRNDVLTFSYVGSPGKGKDRLDMIIEALSRIKTDKQYVFNIIGITKEQHLNNYPQNKELLEALGDRIQFKGRVLKCEALEYLKKSDFSVFFRPDTIVSKAGFPTKYAEAVTCGIPVITNKTSDLGTYLKDGVNGFIIDGYTADDIKAVFEKVFLMTDNEIEDIKNYCERNTGIFHYANYMDKMKGFFENMR